MAENGKGRNKEHENVDILTYPQKAKNKVLSEFWRWWYNDIKSKIKSLIRAF